MVVASPRPLAVESAPVSARNARSALPRLSDQRHGRGGDFRVRIIGGTHRGRIVAFRGAGHLRPTPDRVRETLFNWLGQDLSGRATLEPFAGSGVLSLEALSRGASPALAIDRDPATVRTLRANADALGLGAIETTCGDAIATLARETRRFDAIFLDPPYAFDAWPALFAACLPRLAPDGALYAEAGHPLAPPPGLVVVREGRAGAVHFHLLRRAAEAEPEPAREPDAWMAGTLAPGRDADPEGTPC
jgi:16S rRNA (guanine966-N2)-methyltransferase